MQKIAPIGIIFSRKNDISFGRKRDKRAARQGDALTRNQKHRMADQFPIRITRVALMRVALALLIAAPFGAMVTSSDAQTVPVPKPAPKARDPQSGSDQQRGPATTGSMAVPNPVIPDPRRNVPPS